MRTNYINKSFINLSLYLILSGQLSNVEEDMRKTNPAFAAQYRKPNWKKRIFCNFWFQHHQLI